MSKQSLLFGLTDLQYEMQFSCEHPIHCTISSTFRLSHGAYIPLEFW